MSIRFDVRRRTIMPTRGKILIRPLEKDDWGPSAEVASRFVDRGSLTDPVGSTDDWGELPKTSV